MPKQEAHIIDLTLAGAINTTSQVEYKAMVQELAQVAESALPVQILSIIADGEHNRVNVRIKADDDKAKSSKFRVDGENVTALQTQKLSDKDQLNGSIWEYSLGYSIAREVRNKQEPKATEWSALIEAELVADIET